MAMVRKIISELPGNTVELRKALANIIHKQCSPNKDCHQSQLKISNMLLLWHIVVQIALAIR